jgi:hypothetical protein
VGGQRHSSLLQCARRFRVVGKNISFCEAVWCSWILIYSSFFESSCWLDWLSLLRSVGALLIHATLMDEADIFLLRCPLCLELTRVLSTCSGSVLAANDCFASHEKH